MEGGGGGERCNGTHILSVAKLDLLLVSQAVCQLGCFSFSCQSTWESWRSWRATPATWVSLPSSRCTPLSLILTPIPCPHPPTLTLEHFTQAYCCSSLCCEYNPIMFSLRVQLKALLGFFHWREVSNGEMLGGLSLWPWTLVSES